jgi:AraC-like DNA-binding protein
MRTSPNLAPPTPVGMAAAPIGALPEPRLHRDVAALGWLPPSAGHGGRDQLVLPIDLFLLTLQGDDADGEFDLRVSLLRAGPVPFRAQRRRTLTFALLSPTALLRLLRSPLHGLGERRVALARLCGTTAVAALRDALRGAVDPLPRTQLFGRWIEARLHQRVGWSPAQARVADAAAWLQREGGAFASAVLRQTLAVSTRQLERDFRTWLGVSPAAYARLVRFQRVARAVVDGAPLADAANAHHYCDQSHLNREFREFSALTPRGFAQLARPHRRRAEQQALAGRVFLLDTPPDYKPVG